MQQFKISGPFNIHDVTSAPSQMGLYVWYARFRVDEADWHSSFAEGNESARSRLLKAIRDHSLKFSRHEIKVRANSHFSTTWKGALQEDTSSKWQIDQLTTNQDDRFSAKLGPVIGHDSMRELFVSLLDTGFPLFCSPLYLGKATNQSLRTRLRQHRDHFLDLWERYINDRQYIDRIEDPKDFAERAIRLGFSPEDLFCITLHPDCTKSANIKAEDLSNLIESAEWLLNRWANPILGRQ